MFSSHTRHDPTYSAFAVEPIMAESYQ